MATTYGYGGEFSSDEDIDKMEQHSERLVQSKFDSFVSVKPSKQDIEKAINTIRSMPLDQDISLTDDLLAGLLDYFKTQRGPIVDSTRNLYKRIILRQIRGDQQQASNGDSNGNNNNEINIISKRQEATIVEAASSDEDEPMPPASSQPEPVNKRKFDSRVVYEERLEPMEVDSETPTGAIRSNKPVDISTSSEDESSGSETEESDDESSDPEVLDLTPVKDRNQQIQKTPVTTGSKSSDMVKKPTTAVAEKTDKTAEAKKKPYTRSQRLASARVATSRVTDVSSSKADTVTSDAYRSMGQKTKQAKFPLKFILSAISVALIAALLYYFRSDLTKSSERILNRAIKF